MPNEKSYEKALETSNAIQQDLAVHPQSYTMLTGDRPTGRLHLGHYFGTLKERVRLQNMGINTNIVIADYQVITDRDTTEHIADNVYNMVIDYLACGIDPDKTMIFTHSAIPAENQLMLPFLSLLTEAEMERNPTVKAEQEASGHALTGLLLTYPVHQACDILFCKGNIVPVGRDQLPHIEATNKIAHRFNARYGLTTAGICLNRDPQEIAEEIGNAGSGALKSLVIDAVNSYFEPIRAKRRELEQDMSYIKDVLHQGNARACAKAEQTLAEVREAMGMVY